MCTKNSKKYCHFRSLCNMIKLSLALAIAGFDCGVKLTFIAFSKGLDVLLLQYIFFTSLYDGFTSKNIHSILTSYSTCVVALATI